jgi:heptosyltransferase-2
LNKFLIIQTASIGDVILSTPIIESIHQSYPESEIDILVKKGNEPLFKEHPFLGEVFVWDKKKGKYRNLLKIIRRIRKKNYDYLINLQRFASSGFISLFSRAKYKAGFNKNPLSWSYNRSVEHIIGEQEFIHEVDRNLELIRGILPKAGGRVRLYPSQEDFNSVQHLKETSYICIAPASLWFTKQFPEQKWIEFINTIDNKLGIYLLGSPSDREMCERIKYSVDNEMVINLAGELNLLETSALMKDAVMNFVNDSAPQHLATAVNAPVTAIFCSTIPEFGFGPLSDDSVVIETTEELSCRPCGLHGLNKCPEGHFDCAYSIDINSLKKRIS